MIIAHGPWYTEWHHLFWIGPGLAAMASWIWMKVRRIDAGERAGAMVDMAGEETEGRERGDA